MRHILDITDLGVGEVASLVSVAEDIAAHREKYAHILAGKSSPPSFTSRARGRV